MADATRGEAPQNLLGLAMRGWRYVWRVLIDGGIVVGEDANQEDDGYPA